MSKVVNVKVKFIRPKYDNLKEWCQDCNNEYIGRKGIVFVNGQRYPKKDSIWHNPFKIDKNAEDAEEERNRVLKQYKKYIKRKIKEENLFEELFELEGKTLGCWCHPDKCHGDILVKLIKRWKRKYA